MCGHQVFAGRSPAPGQCGVQQSRGLARPGGHSWEYLVGWCWIRWCSLRAEFLAGWCWINDRNRAEYLDGWCWNGCCWIRAINTLLGLIIPYSVVLDWMMLDRLKLLLGGSGFDRIGWFWIKFDIMLLARGLDQGRIPCCLLFMEWIMSECFW